MGSIPLHLPIEAVRALDLVALGVEAKMYNGEQDRTKDGVPKYAVKVMTSGGSGSLLAVTVASSTPIEVTFGQPVIFLGLRIGAHNGNLWFSADGLGGLS